MKVLKGLPSQKIVSGFLAIALFCCICFSYNNYNDFRKTKKDLIFEKSNIISELRRSRDSLNLAILENSSLKTDLIVERQKVTNLLDEINKTNIDVALLIKYKT